MLRKALLRPIRLTIVIEDEHRPFEISAHTLNVMSVFKFDTCPVNKIDSF